MFENIKNWHHLSSCVKKSSHIHQHCTSSINLTIYAYTIMAVNCLFTFCFIYHVLKQHIKYIIHPQYSMQTKVGFLVPWIRNEESYYRHSLIFLLFFSFFLLLSLLLLLLLLILSLPSFFFFNNTINSLICFLLSA